MKLKCDKYDLYMWLTAMSPIVFAELFLYSRTHKDALFLIITFIVSSILIFWTIIICRKLMLENLYKDKEKHVEEFLKKHPKME